MQGAASEEERAQDRDGPLSLAGTTGRKWRRTRQLGLAIFGLVGVVGFAWYRGYLGDYPHDAAPAVDALAGGDFWGALTVERQPLMGPFSIILRAPFVAVAQSFGAGDLVSYRVGAAPCLAAAGLLGAALVRWFPSSAPLLALGLLAVLLAPATADALELGHPEEPLAAALSVGAVAAGMRGRRVSAAVLLGLALATKQWAVLAVGPTLLAVGRPYWRRVTTTACGIAALLTLPNVLANHQGFATVSRQIASAPVQAQFGSWWYVVDRDLPAWLAQATHPAIVLSAIPLTVLAYRHRIGADGALLLLALLFFIRCVFDPVNNYYYHLPLLLALLTWEMQMRRLVPYATLAVVASLFITNSYLAFADWGLYTASVFYFVWTVGLAAYLVVALRRLAGSARAAPEMSR